MSLIYIAESPRGGRGVFAARKITCGIVVLRRPYIVLNAKDAPTADQDLQHYIFTYPYKKNGEYTLSSTRSALVFGEASLVNHDDNPNCAWQWDTRTTMHEILSMRDIEYNEELTFDYAWAPSVWAALGGKT